MGVDATTSATTAKTSAGNKGFLKNVQSQLLEGKFRYAMNTQGQDFLKFLEELFPAEGIRQYMNAANANKGWLT